MLRAATLIALFASAGALAAPVPAARERIEALWGKPVAASDEYEFSLADERLTIRAAGEPTFNLTQRHKTQMPRVVRTVRGDFVATVRLIDADAPNPFAKSPWASPATKAGLLLDGGKQWAELQLSQYCPSADRGVVRHTMTREVRLTNAIPIGSESFTLDTAEPGKWPHLRVMRTGHVVSVSYRFDATK